MGNKEMIEEMTNISIVSNKINGNTLYLIKKDKTISVVFQFIGDKFCQYIDYSISSFTWKVDSIENFYNKYIKHINDLLKFEEVSRRSYGEPKLTKPFELKGIKPIFSIQCGTRKNQIYIKSNDVWIKDNDYFSSCLSQEEAKQRGFEFNVREKFIYKNNFSPVIFLGQGWLCIRNLLLYIEDSNIKERLENVICRFYHWNITDFVGEIEIFYNDLISKLKELYLN